MKKQQGFTLIELVIVVIILGFLAVAAVPRFIDATDDAKDASVEGVAGGMASAVGLVRAEWELQGRPSTGNVNYDGQTVFIGSNGYPTSGHRARTDVNMGAADCESVLPGILASSPTVTDGANGAASSDYFTTITDDNTNGDLCNFFLVSSLTVVGNDVSPEPTNITTNGHQGFTYRARSSQVTVFKN